MAANNAGYEFEREIGESARHLGWACYKMQAAMSGYEARTRGARVQPAPFDFLMVVEGRAIGIELKSSRAGTPFPFDRLTIDCLKGMEALERSGGRGYIIINMRAGRNNVAWAVALGAWYEIMGRLLPRKSIPVPFDGPEFVEIPRGRVAGLHGEKLIWDLRCLVSTEGTAQVPPQARARP